MKKRIQIIMIISVILMGILPTVSFADDSYVTEKAKAFDTREKNVLEARCGWIKDSGYKLSIISGNSEELSDSEDTVNRCDEIVLWINNSDKKLKLEAFGKAANIFTDEICTEIQDIAQKKYESIGVYEACQSVVVNVENVIKGNEPGNYNFYMSSVVDMSGYLDEEEYINVKEALDEVREAYNMDVALLIEDEMSEKSAMEAADDYFDYYFYGAGEEDNGIILYINMYSREYWFSTHAGGIEIFNDEAIDYLEANVVTYLSDDDFYGAFMEYADDAGYILDSCNETGEPFHKAKNIILIVGLAIIIGLIIGIFAAVAMTNVRKKEMNTALMQADAAEYVKQDSLNINDYRDIFLYSNVVATKKPENDSEGVHTSSSGGSHGGGGGRF